MVVALEEKIEMERIATEARTQELEERLGAECVNTTLDPSPWTYHPGPIITCWTYHFTPSPVCPTTLDAHLGPTPLI